LKELSYQDFDTVGLQAVVFTPDIELSVSKILISVYPEISELFDGEPITLPHSTEIPNEIPRIILKNKAGNLKLEIAPIRINFLWKKTDNNEHIQIDKFFELIIEVFNKYLTLTKYKVGRLALVLTRTARHEKPGLFLATHFCKEELMKAPFDRPENFELHGHKKFKLSKKYDVNSWVRNKTGQLIIENDKSPVVLIEQDINTLSEKMNNSDFNQEDIKSFFSDAQIESAKILKLYYPKN